MSEQSKASLAAAATGILVGAAMVSTRMVSSETTPATLAFLRYLIGLGILVGPVLLSSRTRFLFKDAVAIAILGIFQFAVLIVLLNHALETLSAAICALIFSTMPLVTMGLAILTRREVYSPVKLCGLVLAVSGVALHSSASMEGAHGGIPALAAIIAATLIGAICSLLYRPYLQRYPTLPTSVLAMSAAVIFLGGLCLITAQPLVPHLSTTAWMNVGFIGLSSGLGYFCLLWALGRVDASRVVAFQALGPVTAAAIELTIARQFPSWQLLVAIVLVVAGLLFALREVKRAVPGASLSRFAAR